LEIFSFIDLTKEAHQNLSDHIWAHLINSKGECCPNCSLVVR